MKKAFIRGISAISAAAMLLPFAVMDVSAKETDRKKMVVVGDSISAGTGLADDEKSYVTLLGSCLDAEIVNFAQDTADSAAVLASLDQPDVQAALADADIIVFSAGIHDIMDPFIEQALEYKAEFGFENFSDLFTAKLQEYGFESILELTPYCNKLGEKAKINKDTASQNVLAIGEKLSQYETAQVIALNVYNPMDTLEVYGSLTPKRQLAYDSVCNPVKGAVRDYVNQAYAQIGQQYGYTIVDSFSAFGKEAYKYSYPEKLNCDPTPLGHKVLAKTAAEVLHVQQPGDVNNDFEINAADAALVLLHAGAVGANEPGILTEVQLKAGNVNHDENVNASDAAMILIYAALKGAGEEPDFSDLTGK